MRSLAIQLRDKVLLNRGAKVTNPTSSGYDIDLGIEALQASVGLSVGLLIDRDLDILNGEIAFNKTFALGVSVLKRSISRLPHVFSFSNLNLSTIK